LPPAIRPASGDARGRHQRRRRLYPVKFRQRSAVTCLPPSRVTLMRHTNSAKQDLPHADKRHKPAQFPPLAERNNRVFPSLLMLVMS
jgi:hypothetical protein